MHLLETLELIKIANLLPYNYSIPDYAKEIDVRFAKKTGGVFSDLINEPVLIPATGNSIMMGLGKKQDNSPKRMVRISVKSVGATIEIGEGGSDAHIVPEIACELWKEIENDYPQVATYANKANETVLNQFFDQIPENSNFRYVNSLKTPTLLKLQNFNVSFD